ncbi:hypothetical protein [Pseudomonas fluorescens]|uniref:hypothetical protein n=1 Tax=Pseudomonas fluorescens TaxID=294 RepID=UPI001BE880CD|nr:hypothetical protein [Pseudomonas fluorescens]MBT2340170.1 hypothetical protein [Pseudomonas fluorescens]MCD4530178.1 hypothetical protein [Pseudomonas sp. C3-2018]
MNTDDVDYGHNFEDGERNGWENDVGSLDGLLKTEEGPNTFWSGKLEWRPPQTFQASLAKIFSFPGGEQEKGQLEITFRYRVYPPEPGEATSIGLIVTDSDSLGVPIFWIDERTPHGTWIDLPVTQVPYSGARPPHVVIGTRGGSGPGVQHQCRLFRRLREQARSHRVCMLA